MNFKKVTFKLAIILLVVYFISIGQAKVFAAYLTAPENFSLEVNKGFIALSWENNDETFSHTVIEKSTDNGKFYTLATLNNKSEAYKDRSVSNGHVYTYRAYTNYKSYTSTYTAEIEAIPLYPTNFTIKNSLSNQVDLEWEYPSLSVITIPEYKTFVERRSSSKSTWTILATLPASDTTYRDTTVSADSVYFYRIRTQYPNGSSSYNIPSDLGLSTRTAYPLTTNLSGYAVSNTKINLEWDMTLSNGGKAILQKKNSDGGFDTIYSSKINDHYTDSSLTRGETYTYRLMIRSNHDMSSEFTDEIDIVAELVPAPYDLLASALSEDRIILSWAYPYETETGLEVWRKAADNWELLSTLPKNAQDFTDNSITGGQTYTYKIRAKRGDAAFSCFSQPITVNNTYSAIPGKLIFRTSQNRLHIYSSENVPANTTYTLEIRNGLNGEWLDLKTCMKDTLFTSVSYTSKSEFCFRLRASSNGNLTTYSPEAYFYGAAPEPAQSFNASIAGYDRVILTWKDTNYKEEGYQIYRTVNGDKKLLGNVDRDGEIFIDNNPIPGATARYELIAYNASGQSASPVITIAIPKKLEFKDIGNYKWAHTAINTLSGLGALDYQNGYFGPKNTVSCGQLAHLILKSFDIPYDTQGFITPSDLPINHIYYQDLMTAVNLGLLHPDSKGRIYPDKSVLRGNILYFLNNTLGFLDTPLHAYDTVELESYADYERVLSVDAPIVASFTGDGIITGKSGGLLGLTDKASKVESVVIIYRTLKKYR